MFVLHFRRKRPMQRCNSVEFHFHKTNSMNPPSSDARAVRGRSCPALAVDLASRRTLLAGLVGLLLMLPGRGFALDPAKDRKQYNCRTWNRLAGLPATSINAITQTRDGYLWFGTAAGLLRFDGTEFKALDLHSVADCAPAT